MKREIPVWKSRLPRANRHRSREHRQLARLKLCCEFPCVAFVESKGEAASLLAFAVSGMIHRIGVWLWVRMIKRALNGVEGSLAALPLSSAALVAWRCTASRAGHEPYSDKGARDFDQA